MSKQVDLLTSLSLLMDLLPTFRGEPKVAIQVVSVPLTHSDLSDNGREETGDTMDTSESYGITWKSSKEIEHSIVISYFPRMTQNCNGSNC